MDKSDVIEFLTKQEAQINNLQELVRSLTYRQTGIAGTKKEPPLFDMVDLVLHKIRTTSKTEGPEHESYFVWDATKDCSEVSLANLLKETLRGVFPVE